jgi:hypothetical protein
MGSRLIVTVPSQEKGALLADGGLVENVAGIGVDGRGRLPVRD